MQKIFGIVSGLALLMSFAPGVSWAQTVSASVQAQIDLITSLNQQIKALQDQQKGLVQSRNAAVTQLVTTLKAGSSGDQVKILQALLAADASIYPEGLITGKFGSATARAVKRLQKLNGIEQSGTVGPKTLKKLNELFGDTHVSFEDASSSDRGEDREGSGRHATSTSGEHRPCVIVPPGHLIASGWLRKNGDAKPIVPECQTIPPGIWKKINATSTPTSTVDTIPPVISLIMSSTTASTAATITWTTNESATSKVYYGTTSPLSLTSTSTLTATNTTLVTAHSMNLSGLTASTTYYYYVVESADASSNRATSTQQMFVTAQ